MKKLVTLTAAFAALTPMLAFAQLGTLGTNIIDAVNLLSTVVNGLIPVAFAAALLFFFYGLAKYILGDASDKEAGRNLMIWGVVALFVMASIWGLVGFLQSAFGISGDKTEENPSITPVVP
jgi:hypothetical protein